MSIYELLDVPYYVFDINKFADNLKLHNIGFPIAYCGSGIEPNSDVYMLEEANNRLYNKYCLKNSVKIIKLYREMII